MAVMVKIGEVYDTAAKKCGIGKQGDYLLFPVKAAKGYDTVTVWANKVTNELKIADHAKVAAITSVSLSSKEWNGKWIKNFDVHADLEPVTLGNQDKSFDEYMPMPTDDEVNALFGLV